MLLDDILDFLEDGGFGTGGTYCRPGDFDLATSGGFSSGHRGPRDLGLLCKSAWQALRQMFQEVCSDSSAVPGVVPLAKLEPVQTLVQPKTHSYDAGPPSPLP